MWQITGGLSGDSGVVTWNHKENEYSNMVSKNSSEWYILYVVESLLKRSGEFPVVTRGTLIPSRK